MDPLSITVSIVTLIGAITTTVKTTKSLYSIPGEVDSLLNDLADSQVMLGSVEDCLQGHQGAAPILHNQMQELREDLLGARTLVQSLSIILQGDLSAAQGGYKIGRYAWLRAKRKIRELKDKLERIRQRLQHRLHRFER